MNEMKGFIHTSIDAEGNKWPIMKLEAFI